jgi:hypothetical protein
MLKFFFFKYGKYYTFFKEKNMTEFWKRKFLRKKSWEYEVV